MSMTSNMPRKDAQVPAADTDRIQLAQLLTNAAAQGQMPMSEYEERLSKVYAAQTYTELDRLSADLPNVSLSLCHGGECRPAPSSTLLALLSGFERRGRWNVPSRLTAFALWGTGLIDLRYADFTSTDVEIRSYSIMGGQTILVPPEINVEVSGFGIMGGFDRDAAGVGTPGAPRVSVRGFSLWGKVGVRRKKRRPQQQQSTGQDRPRP